MAHTTRGHKALIYVLEHSFYMRINIKKKKNIHLLHTNKNAVLKCYALKSTRLKLLINKAFLRSQCSEQTVLWPTIHRGYVLTADLPQINLDFILLWWQMSCTHNLLWNIRKYYSRVLTYFAVSIFLFWSSKRLHHLLYAEKVCLVKHVVSF